MIGKGPYANQSGVGLPVMNSSTPGVPPDFAFLNKTVQAIAIVHEGIMYGTVASVLINPFPGTSVLTTNHAINPPMNKATAVAPSEIVNE